MKLVAFIFAFISFASGAAAEFEGTGDGSSNRLQAPRIETSFEPVKVPIQSEQALQSWVTSNKSQLGMSAASNIETLQTTIEDNGYSIFRIQQKVNDIDVFAHQSVLILSEGQPISAHLATTDLPAKSPVSLSNLEQAVKQGLADLQVNYQGELKVEPVYWKTAKELIPAAVVKGKLTKNKLDYLYTLVISSAGQLLTAIPNRLDFDYGLIDVDEMCQVVGYNRPTSVIELLIMADSGYIQSYPPADSQSTSSTTKERKLASTLDDANAYLQSQFNHNGIDRNNNVTVLAFVGNKFYEESLSCAGNNSTNAFWTELSDTLGLMQIHAPLLQNPEVIMHELTHGIVAYGAGLIYQQQSGALNEAIGDALGVGFVSWKNKRVNAPASSDWKLRLGSQVIRDFSYPTRVQNMPDHYSDRYTGSEDHGGVHINSSIINHGFYLLAEGGSHRRLGGEKVPKIGMKKALQIWQYGATKILTQTSDFEDARYAFARSAEIIFGKYGIERTAVHMAFDAIGVKGRWTKNVPPPKPDPKPDPKPEPKVDPKPDPIPDPKPDPIPDPKVDPKPDPIPEPKSEPSKEVNQNALFLAVGVLLLFLIVLIFVVKRARPGKPDNPAYAPYNVTPTPASNLSEKKVNPKVIAQGNFGYFATGGEYFVLSNQGLIDKGITIGRSGSADITLAHPSVSSFHLRLFLQDNQLYMEDLGSSYGTFIGDEKLKKHQATKLNKGDEIVLSDLACSITDSQNSPNQHKEIPQEVESTLTLQSTKGSFVLASQNVISGAASIGRNSTCDVVIAHDSISGSHGSFSVKNGNWYYQDTGSSYGSFIKKGDRLEQVEKGTQLLLKHGTILYMADLKVEVSIESRKGKLTL